MKSVFASEDIAALVTAFPPSIPSIRQPSLVQHARDDTLLNSSKVAAQFRSILQSSSSRVDISDLARRLEIANADWLLDSDGQTLFYSQDERALLPDGEVHDLENIIKDADYVDVIQFSKEHCVALRTVNVLLQRISSSDPDAFQVLDSSKEFVYKPIYAQNAKNAVFKLLSSSEDVAPRIIDVGAELSLPIPFLRQMVEAVLAQQNDSVNGKFERDGSKILFIPSNYGDVEDKRKRQEHQNQVQGLIDQISKVGYCVLPEDNAAASSSKIIEDVMSSYRMSHTEEEALIFVGTTDVTSPWSAMLSTPETLRTQLEAMERGAAMQIRASWQAYRDSKKESEIIDSTLESACHDSGIPSECITILLSSTSHMEPVCKVLAARIAEAEQADVEQFRVLVQESLLAEIDLYACGYATIVDSTLQNNLEEYLGDELRRYVVPEAITLFRTHTDLLNKSRTRDLDKFQQAIHDAKGFKDVQAAATKFAKRQKIDAPSSTLIHAVKIKGFRQKIQLMRKNTTGSFLLQNLTWILLSLAVQRSEKQAEAKFMSAGKDTTRMIRQYQAVGDPEVGKQLMHWRGVLKNGAESARDLQEMQTVAEQAVADMDGVDEENSDA